MLDGGVGPGLEEKSSGLSSGEKSPKNFKRFRLKILLNNIISKAVNKLQSQIIIMLLQLPWTGIE